MLDEMAFYYEEGQLGHPSYVESLAKLSVRGFGTPSPQFIQRLVPSKDGAAWFLALCKCLTEITLNKEEWMERMVFWGVGGNMYKGEACGTALFDRLGSLDQGKTKLVYPIDRPKECQLLRKFNEFFLMASGTQGKSLQFLERKEDEDVSDLVDQIRDALLMSAFSVEGQEGQREWGQPPCTAALDSILSGCRGREDEETLLRHFAKAVIVLLAEVSATSFMIDEHERGVVLGRTEDLKMSSGNDMRLRLDAFFECLIPLGALASLSFVSGKNQLITGKDEVLVVQDEARRNLCIAPMPAQEEKIKTQEQEKFGAIRDSPLKAPKVTSEERLGRVFAEMDMLRKEIKEKTRMAEELEAGMFPVSMEEEQPLEVPGILFHQLMSGGEELSLLDYLEQLRASNQ